MAEQAISIERGVIRDKKADGATNAYLYKVESLARSGVLSRWMEAVNAYVNEYRGEPPEEIKAAYDVGDQVYYFMYPDRRGMILGGMRTDI